MFGPALKEHRNTTADSFATCCGAQAHSTPKFHGIFQAKFTDRGVHANGTVANALRSLAAAGSGYNPFFDLPRETHMEAEHLNSIANKLDDIAQRAAELRRYL